MKYQILDLVADGATQDWSYTGAASAWEACLRGSGDASYISSAILNDVCQFVVAVGTVPSPGFVSGITLHYRIISTVETRIPKVLPTILHNGVSLVCSEYGADTTRSDEVQKLSGYNDGSPHRFSAADVADLVVQFEVSTAPGSGEFQLSEAWLVVEFCDTREYYDPVGTAATPDAITGYLVWNTVGGEAQSISASDLLYFEDTSNVDLRSYWRSLPA